MAAFKRAPLTEHCLSHIAPELVDEHDIGPPNDVERYGLVVVAAGTLHLKIVIAGIEGVPGGRAGESHVRGCK
ncbi:hypothetical protein ACVIGB_008289 [Bradyrhizobium sp. USDA 4341]